MTASTFNPLATARDLEAAGFERKQAEALAEAVHHTVDRDALATKSDLTHFATKTDLAELRADLYRALWIQGGAIVAILTAPGWMPAGAGLRFFPV